MKHNESLMKFLAQGGASSLERPLEGSTSSSIAAAHFAARAAPPPPLVARYDTDMDDSMRRGIILLTPEVPEDLRVLLTPPKPKARETHETSTETSLTRPQISVNTMQSSIATQTQTRPLSPLPDEDGAPASCVLSSMSSAAGTPKASPLEARTPPQAAPQWNDSVLVVSPHSTIVAEELPPLPQEPLNESDAVALWKQVAAASGELKVQEQHARESLIEYAERTKKLARQLADLDAAMLPSTQQQPQSARSMRLREFSGSAAKGLLSPQRTHLNDDDDADIVSTASTVPPYSTD